MSVDAADMSVCATGGETGMSTEGGRRKRRLAGGKGITAEAQRAQRTTQGIAFGSAILASLRLHPEFIWQGRSASATSGETGMNKEDPGERSGARKPRHAGKAARRSACATKRR